MTTLAVSSPSLGRHEPDLAWDDAEPRSPFRPQSSKGVVIAGDSSGLIYSLEAKTDDSTDSRGWMVQMSLGAPVSIVSRSVHSARSKSDRLILGKVTDHLHRHRWGPLHRHLVWTVPQAHLFATRLLCAEGHHPTEKGDRRVVIPPAPKRSRRTRSVRATDLAFRPRPRLDLTLSVHPVHQDATRTFSIRPRRFASPLSPPIQHLPDLLCSPCVRWAMSQRPFSRGPGAGPSAFSTLARSGDTLETVRSVRQAVAGLQRSRLRVRS